MGLTGLEGWPYGDWQAVGPRGHRSRGPQGHKATVPHVGHVGMTGATGQGLYGSQLPPVDSTARSSVRVSVATVGIITQTFPMPYDCRMGSCLRHNHGMVMVRLLVW